MQSFILSYVFYFCVSIFFFSSCIRLLLSDFVKIHFPGLTERNGRPYQQLVRSLTRTFAMSQPGPDHGSA